MLDQYIHKACLRKDKIAFIIYWGRFSCLFIFIFKNQEGTGNWEEPSSHVICSSTLLWNPSLCFSRLTAVVPVWLNFEANSWAPVLLAVSLTVLPAVLKDNESRLSDWPLYPWVNERASAELTLVSWFPPGEPGVVLSPPPSAKLRLDTP